MIDLLVTCVRLHPSSIPCLHLMDLFVTCVQTTKEPEVILSRLLFDRIYSCLEFNLSSPFSLVIVVTVLLSVNSHNFRCCYSNYHMNIFFLNHKELFCNRVIDMLL